MKTAKKSYGTFMMNSVSRTSNWNELKKEEDKSKETPYDAYGNLASINDESNEDSNLP